jgi:hypothetical protein
MGAKSPLPIKNGQRDFLIGMGIRMKEISYWDQFISSGKIEDYLKFKEQTRNESSSKGEAVSAGFYHRNGNDYQGSAYR